MASPKIPWQRRWREVWRRIPQPLVDGRLRVAVDMLTAVAHLCVGTPIRVIADRWFGNDGLYRPLSHSEFDFHLLSRLRANITLYDLPPKRSPDQRGASRKYGARLGSAADRAAGLREKARAVSVFLYAKQPDVLAYDQRVIMKNLRCPVRVVWVFTKSRWVAFFTTDRTLSIQQIIEFYGARWKIDSGYKEIKQDIGSAKSQTRNAHAVTNHLNVCMMAAAVTWLYADRIKADPERRHLVKGRTSFAFSDVRRLVANGALSEDFLRLCPASPKPRQNAFVAVLLRRVA